MITITLYEEATGRLLATRQLSSIADAEIQGLPWIEGDHDPLTHYVVDGVVTPRPEATMSISSGSTFVLTDGDQPLSGHFMVTGKFCSWRGQSEEGVVTVLAPGPLTVFAFPPFPYQEIKWEGDIQPTSGPGIQVECDADAVSAEVNIERNARLKRGFVFEGRLYDFDDQAKSRVTGAGTLAGFAIGAGAPEGYYHWHGGNDPFAWIAADNSQVVMDAPTCFRFAQAAAEHERAHIFAARVLKDSNPLPTNWRDDEHWPVIALEPNPEPTDPEPTDPEPTDPEQEPT